jgi:hypothetical protein
MGSNFCTRASARSDVFRRPRPHERHVFDRGHEIAVVVEVADDGFPDLAQQRFIRLHRQLPEQMVRERLARRERVLDRRELLDFGWCARPIAVIEIVAEEVLVILVVPGVALFLVLLLFLFLLSLLDRLYSSVGTSSSMGFSTISWLSSSDSSSVDIGRSLIAC